MIRVAGRPDSPTFLRTSSVSNTANLLPLDVLVGLLDQPGDLHLGIDVAQRRAPGAPRHRISRALQHAAGRPPGRRAAQHPAGGAAGHSRVGGRAGVPPLDRHRRRGGHRTHHQRPVPGRGAG